MVMLPRMRKASPPNIFYSINSGSLPMKLPDPVGELLIVGHGGDRTGRRSQAARSRMTWRAPWRARRSGMFGVDRIYDFAAFCLPWSALCFCPPGCCRWPSSR
jgi:hypothetical protein